MKLVCPHCNFSKEIDRSKVPSTATKATCPKCRQKFDLQTSLFEDSGISVSPEPSPREWSRPAPDIETEALAADVVSDGGRTDSAEPPPLPLRAGFQGRDRGAGATSGREGGIPWEEGTGGFLGDFFATVRLAMFSPGAFFDQLPTRGGTKKPLLFGLICGCTGVLLAIFWQAAFALLGMGVSGQMSQMMHSGNLAHIPMTYILIALAAIIILLPVITIVGLYLSSALIHLFLMIVRGAGGGFEATFRVISYASAPQLVNIVPFVGGFVSGVWALVLLIMGLPRAHNTSVGRVLIGVLVIPLGLFIFLIVAAIVVGVVLSSR